MKHCHGFVPFLITVWALSPSPIRAQGFSPQDALRRTKVPEGFRVRLVACEPAVRQPVTMSFDDRGRLWVIQYLQYPNPKGLKPVQVDEYLRTVYDKIPDPPPKGPRGADRITILEDPDEHGCYRKAKDFVRGLNLASGMALGHGGVFVAQPPYLLFYPDKNRDDVPDGDPQVLLKGFGMQDAHAFPNSLQWGPDGWLYGAQGSTVTSKIRGIEFQQGIWRYHPLTRRFELFAEGGGNTWGLDFDRHGNAIAGTNWGGYAMLHQVQGGYYVKGFGKHGPLHNPHAYGYFEHVPYKNFKGGHVTCGGVLYRGGSYPARFNDRYIAGNLLSNAVYWHELVPYRSSFTARFGGDFLVAHDSWFRPVDCLVGPDGSVYVADWYDKRATHLDPRDNWDRSNGRIYKVEYRGTGAFPNLDLARLSSKELVGLLSHRNDWYVREARRILAERRDRTVLPSLRKLIREHPGGLALEALWALYVTGGFDETLAAELLRHPNEDVRTWTVRFLGDARKVSPAMRDHLAALARTDTSPTVRSQLASSAKRLPSCDGMPVVGELLRRDEDVDDPHIPLLLWWAVEDKAISDREAVLSLLGSPGAWRAPLVRRFLVERLGRRYMAEGKLADLATCGRLLDMAPVAAEVRLLLQGMAKALEGRRLERVPAALRRHLETLRKTHPGDATLLCLGLRVGSASAYRRALRRVADPSAPVPERVRLIEILGQIGKPEGVPLFLGALDGNQPAPVRLAAVSALQAFADPRIPERLLALYSRLPADLRARAQGLLCSRPASALALLRAVDAGRIAPKEISLDQLRRLARYKSASLDRLVAKHWGKVAPATAGEKVTRIRAVAHTLQNGRGDPVNGRRLFAKHCGTCHTLFGEGNKIGPDLTGADRKNRDFLLTNIIDPSALIRPEYLAYDVETTDGRRLTGLLVESAPKAVTLVDAKNERTVLARDRIESLEASPVSLMPEKLLDELNDQEVRDLFSHLEGDGPAKAPRRVPAKKDAGPLRVCLVSGSLEYQSDASLAALQKYVEKDFPVRCTRAFRKADDDLPGLENLKTCDVMLLFTRRLTITGKQLDAVKQYCRAGKPIVAVRTASHAFQNWPALDKEVLGGNYQGHYGAGPVVRVQIAAAAKNHPVLAGVKPFTSAGSLYKNPGLARDITLLLVGSIPGHTEPVAWTRRHKGGRVFYTSLGHPKDFQDGDFRRLLVNALFWTAKRTPR
jgi:putative membrane-bound dehydrogenase-like protein